MSAVADKLREARALVERGWVQGDYATCRGVCAYGAIQQVANGDAEDCTLSPLFDQMAKAVRRAVGNGALVSWNDNPKRTQAEVLAAFDKAIELAEQEVAL